MKNAGFFIVSCILLSILVPFAIFMMRNDEPHGGDVILSVLDKDNVYEMALEDYVFAVLRKEVPAIYETETLKAQAVAIRSYALKRARTGLHENADVCTDFTHCMAFTTDEEVKGKWGKDFTAYNEKFKKAVEETKNQVLVYKGEIAESVFFAISSGKTENASDVWGKSVPYLVSVDSVEDVNAERYESVVEVSRQEFMEKLGTDDIRIDSIERSEAGGVKNITVCGKKFKGSEIRQLFSLRSANFEISVKECVEFKVKGYGHGVGMSQNGANECALKGMTYKEILSKYYIGTQTVDLFGK